MRCNWDEAWSITCKTFAYTNHTLLPEALERWSLEVFGRVLPRHLEIIYDINAHFLEEVRMRFLRRRRAHPPHVASSMRAASATCAWRTSRASAATRSTALPELHTELLKRDVLKDFYELWPGKFSNKTNGVTPRRWMALSNPRLSSLITEHIGEGWIKDLAQLEALEPLAEDAGFRARWREIKQENKRNFAALALGAHRDRHRSRLDVRRPGETHSRVQAPALEGAAHRLDVSRHEIESGRLRSSRAPSFSAARRLPATTSPSS